MKAKKSLGQNFLKSGPALRKIIEAGEVTPDDVILEIGPGKGALTEKLLLSAGRVIAVEKDHELYEMLKEKFAVHMRSRSLVLVHDDILDFDIKQFLNGKANAQSLKPGAYKIIANIPYNITGAILKKFLTAEIQPGSMVLLVQKEVAQRIVARDGKESVLSISVKAYGEPKMVMKVPARYFSPAPKVDSAVISIKNISRGTFKEKNVDEGRFWEIVKAGFAHKRKKLSSNLKILLRNPGFVSKNSPPLRLENLENKRAEELSLSDWVGLAKS